jgi:hypothetical protein
MLPQGYRTSEVVQRSMTGWRNQVVPGDFDAEFQTGKYGNHRPRPRGLFVVRQDRVARQNRRAKSEQWSTTTTMPAKDEKNDHLHHAGIHDRDHREHRLQQREPEQQEVKKQ